MRWPRFDELDDGVVTQAYEYTVQLIRERHADADMQRGLLGSFVSKLHAILQATLRTVVQDIHSSLSVKAVIANPGQAKQELVDKLIENVGGRRKHIAKAKGYVHCVLKWPARISIIAGEIFTSEDGQIFYADNSITFKEPDIPLRGYDEAHLLKSGDKYNYTIAVTARDGGGAAPKRNTLFTPHIAPASLDTAYADDDFHGSFVFQDDTDIARQILTGMTAPGYSSHASVEAMIRKADPDKYRFVAAVDKIQVVGVNDPDGKPGLIEIRVSWRPGSAEDTLLEELRRYLNEPTRVCLSTNISVVTGVKDA